MLIDLGNFSLSVAILLALGALFFSIAAARAGSAAFLSAARWLLGAFAVVVTFSSVLLMIAMVTSDFRLEYVAHYSERALPLGYKMAAFWAGQAGSLLLWAWILGMLNLVLVIWHRHARGVEPAAVLATLAIVSGFFVALMLFVANPFQTMQSVPLDGYGLNPMLQNPGMIIHPPLTFVGYAGYTYPFALMVGAMIAGRRDNDWVTGLRRWSLFAWIFLGGGIIWGGEWAYAELGWGGYWAWDPVENASLLPWLTGAALLHAIIVHRQRGMFKMWTVGLIAASFVLCIFGTYLTRSGVIQSVHAFGASGIGYFFLTFIILSTLFSGWLMVWRRRLLADERPLERLISREGAFLGVNVLLTVIMLVTLVGTIFPILSSITVGRQISVGEPFYNTIVVPMLLVLVALMAVAPTLRYGIAAGQMIRRLAVPVVAGAATVAALWFWGIRDLWALTSGLIAAVVVFGIGLDLLSGIWTRMRSTHENPLTATVRLLGANHRRYGGWVVHTGVILMVVGVAGSSLFKIEKTHQFAPGETMQLGSYTLTFNHLEEVRQTNFTAVRADMTIEDGRGRVSSMYPERRFFDKSEKAYSEVAIQSGLSEDLYLILAGWEGGGRITAIQAMVNPLVTWIWIGGFVMAAGVLISMLPRLLPRSGKAEAAAVLPGGEQEPAPAQTGRSKAPSSKRRRKRRRHGQGPQVSVPA